MKYLFTAIDLRAHKVKPSSHQSSVTPKPRFNSNLLKKLIIDASEGQDEKSTTHEFVDTLERIVNEIRNTTEHSTAFLQRVKKSEAPDYYSIITRPMDLATLLKRVKALSYRNKKAFADDLDLIWSNCLAYNSHPAHPLRASAEILRNKSNQLLEFITDPSLPTRPAFAAQLAGNTPTSKQGTPGVDVREAEGEGDDDAEVIELDSDEEESHPHPGRGGMINLNSATQRLINEENENSRDRSASPAGSRSESQTPFGERRKAARAQVGARSRSQGSVEPPFEERIAILRTAQSMQTFIQLDRELDKMEQLFPDDTGPSTSNILDIIVAAPQHARVLALINTINPPIPSTSSSATPVPESASEPATPAPPPTLTPAPQLPSTIPESLWWQSITSTTSASGLGAGLPDCGFVGVKAKKPKARKTLTATDKGKGRETATSQLGVQMKQSVETLRQIRRLHRKLAQGRRTSGIEGDAASDRELSESDQDVSSSEEMETGGSQFAPVVPLYAFKTHAASATARASLAALTCDTLAHAGFQGSSSVAVGVLQHVAAEYMTNLGRTLKFYSDRYGSKMTPEEIMLHVLRENGVPDPGALECYVKEDITRHGEQLSNLHARLAKSREDQLDKVEESPIAGGEEQVFENDCESLARGHTVKETGEDIFGIKSLGLEKCLNQPFMIIPKRLYRGDPKRSEMDAEEVEMALLIDRPAYPPPPRFGPLTATAIDAQIGLLRPLYLQRQTMPELGLIEDVDSTIKIKSTRPKVLGATGKIPIKIKRKNDDSLGGLGGVGGSKKRRKKVEVV